MLQHKYIATSYNQIKLCFKDIYTKKNSKENKCNSSLETAISTTQKKTILQRNSEVN